MLNIYPLIRPLLFHLSPERALKITMWLLHLAPSWLCPRIQPDPVNIMGLTFPNRIGLAAGIDDNADYFDVLAKLGVGFIEVGGVTPQPQSGNPMPRVFRLIKEKSIINRKGFANKGVAYLVARLKKRKFTGVIGVNIAKMKETPLEDAFDDYKTCYEQCHPVADFVTLNISSPNTPQLRALQTPAYLEDLLSKMKALQKQCHENTGRYVPLTVKIAPDMDDNELKNLADSLIKTKIDGVILTNTTLSREMVNDPMREETGGLSGAGLTALSRQRLKTFANWVEGKIPIIAVGGIVSAEEAARRLSLGASLIQVYTGLIYHGPKLLEDISERISA